jgi:cytoskeletal protein RodZ
MKTLKSGLIVLGSAGLLLLGACSNDNQTANTENNQTTVTSTTNSTTQSPVPSATTVTETEGQHGKSYGGQVVETGKYHLELVPEKEANGTHLDFYLQKGDNHEAIPDAKVTAQVQSPDGKQQTVPFTYDAKDKHYTGLLSETATGQYQVKVTADVKGEKVDGRFNFNR